MAKKTKKPEPKLEPKLTDLNLRWCTHYTYDNGTEECHCGDNYCRCRTIINAKVTNVYLDRIRNEISQFFGVEDQVNLYGVDRILSIFKVWDPDSWEISVCGGYYGEEIDKVYLKESDEIEDALRKLFALDSMRQKIEFLLTLGYGYLLDVLFDCSYSIQTISKTQVDYQRDHYVRLDKNVLEAYKEYDLPRGIVLKQGSRYRLIDGYHRFTAGGETVTVFVASK